LPIPAAEAGLLRDFFEGKRRNVLEDLTACLVDDRCKRKEKQLLPDLLKWLFRYSVDQCPQDFPAGIVVRRFPLVVEIRD
jgi:hypothetical protein